ncbi:hypothetical protein ACOMHN_018443 [Nucella lapillus]
MPSPDACDTITLMAAMSNCLLPNLPPTHTLPPSLGIVPINTHGHFLLHNQNRREKQTAEGTVNRDVMCPVRSIDDIR